MKELIEAVAKKFNLTTDDVAINIWGVDLSGSFYKDEEEVSDVSNNTLIMFDRFDTLTVKEIEDCEYNDQEKQYYINNYDGNPWGKW